MSARALISRLQPLSACFRASQAWRFGTKLPVMGNVFVRLKMELHPGYGVTDADPENPPPRPTPTCIRCTSDPRKRKSKLETEFDTTSKVVEHYENFDDNKEDCNNLLHYTDAELACEYCGNLFPPYVEKLRQDPRKNHYDNCPHRMWDAWDEWKKGNGY